MPATCRLTVQVASSRLPAVPRTVPEQLSVRCAGSSLRSRRAKANWQRMTNMQTRYKKVFDYAKGIVEWRNPTQSFVAIVLGVVLSYYPPHHPVPGPGLPGRRALLAGLV